jgi:hypothetical protein
MLTSTKNMSKLDSAGAGACQALRYITVGWDPMVERYWPTWAEADGGAAASATTMQPPAPADLVTEGENTALDAFFLETSDTDQPSSLFMSLAERLQAELNKDSTQERLEKEIEKGLDLVLGKVTFFGLNVGAAASGAAKLLTSQLINFASFVIGEVMKSASFREILVVHRTIWRKGDTTEPLSVVTWATRKHGEAPEPLAPTQVGGTLASSSVLLSHHCDTPGIYWRGASIVPFHLAAEWDANTDPNKDPKHVHDYEQIHSFLLKNSATHAIYWPTSSQEGGRVFVPIQEVTGDACYCVALRTEVRGTYVRQRKP